jgi:hypothetical protein
MPSQPSPIPDMNLVSYRLKEIETNLEKNIEKLSTKIDLLLAELNKTTIIQSETRVKVEKLEAEVKSLKRIDEEVRSEITKLKVSVAERLSWGAAGGVLATALVKLAGVL